MNIPIIDNIVMTSDLNNIILNRKQRYTKGKNKGKEYLSPYAYFSDIIQALEDCLLTKLSESDAETMQELLAEHKKLTKYFRKLLGTKQLNSRGTTNG